MKISKPKAGFKYIFINTNPIYSVSAYRKEDEESNKFDDDFI
jgi:hypothetical protein